MIPRILMCPPEHYAIEYEINPWMDRRIGADPVQSRAQWQSLHETLIDLGAAVELVEPLKGLPDMVFTANAGLVYRNLFLVSRFKHGVRQGESAIFAKWAYRPS